MRAKQLATALQACDNLEEAVLIAEHYYKNFTIAKIALSEHKILLLLDDHSSLEILNTDDAIKMRTINFDEIQKYKDALTRSEKINIEKGLKDILSKILEIAKKVKAERANDKKA